MAYRRRNIGYLGTPARAARREAAAKAARAAKFAAFRARPTSVNRGLRMGATWARSRRSLMRSMNGVHTFQKMYSSDLVMSPMNNGDGITTSPGYELTYRLSDCAGSTELNNLFDQYRIVRADLNIMPQFIVNVTEATAGYIGQDMLYLWVFNDKDGQAIPFTEDVCKERATARCLFMDGVKKWSCLDPCASGVIGVDNTSGTGTVTSSSPTISPWIDTTQPTVKHYGTYFKVGLVSQGAQYPTGANSTKIRVQVTLTIQCRTLR